MNSTIDIIVPVYNTPDLDLDICFNSILSQDFNDWRLIVVDDGSKKETANYLDEWEKKDNRIEVHHYENGGPPVARNRGLALLSAPYFMLVDSDDILTQSFLSHSLHICKAHGLDMIVGSVDVVNEKGETIELCKPTFSKDGLNDELKIYEGDSVRLLLDFALSTHKSLNNAELNNIMLGRLYPKLIKTSSFQSQGIRFEDSMFNHDDNMFSFDILATASKVAITSCIYYKYIEHQFSIVHRKASEKILKEELAFLSALRRREKQYQDLLCYDALTIRYLNIIMACMAVTSSIREADIKKTYARIDKIIDLDKLARVLNADKYVLNKKEMLFYRLLRVRNTKLRKFLICTTISIYRTIKAIKRG